MVSNTSPGDKEVMQTVDRIVEVLEEAGIDHVFGIPTVTLAIYAKG